MKRHQLVAAASILLVGFFFSPDMTVAAKGGSGHGRGGRGGGGPTSLARPGGSGPTSFLRAGAAESRFFKRQIRGGHPTISYVRNTGTAKDYLAAVRTSQRSSMHRHSIISKSRLVAASNQKSNGLGNTLWPDDYDGSFWDYGPGVSFWAMYWPYGEFVDSIYNEAGASSGNIYIRRAVATTEPPSALGEADVAETCGGFAREVADLPIRSFEKIAAITEDQRSALRDLKNAFARASGILKRSCASKTLITPVARLDELQRHLKAMQEADEAVRGPFLRFYGLLTGGQKQQLNGFASAKTGHRSKVTRADDVNLGVRCSSQTEFTDVPAGEIARTVKLDDVQMQQLDKLKAASAKASDGLKASCPATVPNTADGRLDAAQKRVTALIQAVETIRPALSDFFKSLTDEQKAALIVQTKWPQKAAKRN